MSISKTRSRMLSDLASISGSSSGNIIIMDGDDTLINDDNRPPGLNSYQLRSLQGVIDQVGSPAGAVGEESGTSGAGINLVSGTAKDVLTPTIPAGEFEVWSTITFIPAASTSITQYGGCQNSVSNTFNPTQGAFANIVGAAFVPGSAASNNMALTLPRTFMQNLTPTVFRLIALATFTVSTLQAGGLIKWRRIG